MGYCAPALSYVDFRLGGVGISGIKSVWLFNFGFDKGRFKKINKFLGIFKIDRHPHPAPILESYFE